MLASKETSFHPFYLSFHVPTLFNKQFSYIANQLHFFSLFPVAYEAGTLDASSYSKAPPYWKLKYSPHPPKFPCYRYHWSNPSMTALHTCIPSPVSLSLSLSPINTPCNAFIYNLERNAASFFWWLFEKIHFISFTLIFVHWKLSNILMILS